MKSHTPLQAGICQKHTEHEALAGLLVRHDVPDAVAREHEELVRACLLEMTCRIRIGRLNH